MVCVALVETRAMSPAVIERETQLRLEGVLQPRIEIRSAEDAVQVPEADLFT